MTTKPNPATTANTSRAGEILSAIDALITEHNAWVRDSDSDQFIPPQSFDHAAADCADVIARGDVPGELARLCHRVLEFCRLWAMWKDGDHGAAEVKRDNLGYHRGKVPHPKCWYAFQQMQQVREQTAKPPEPKTLEPVSMLLSQGVSVHQIALIFATHRDSDGRYHGPILCGEWPTRRTSDLRSSSPMREAKVGERFSPDQTSSPRRPNRRQHQGHHRGFPRVGRTTPANRGPRVC